MRTLRRRSIVLMTALLGALTLCSGVSAMTVDLLWAGSGTAVTGGILTGSEVLTLDVYASWSTPPPTVQGVVMSIRWDSDILSLTGCDLVNEQTAGGGTWAPLVGNDANCPTSSAGLQRGIDQFAASFPDSAGTLKIGSLTFHVTGMTPGNFSYSFVTPFMSVDDGWIDGNLNLSFNAVFNNATVIVPEPATAMLVGAGFIGLIAAGRRRRRG